MAEEPETDKTSSLGAGTFVKPSKEAAVGMPSEAAQGP